MKNVYMIVTHIYCLQLVKGLFSKFLYFIHNKPIQTKMFNKLGLPLD